MSANKYNVIIKISALLFFLSLISYLGFKFYNAYNYRTSYSTDFNKNNFRDENRSVYIDEDKDDIKFGKSTIINDEYAVEILSSPVNLVWRPKQFIFKKPLDKKITVSVTLKGAYPWFLSPIYEDNEKRYEQIYYPELNDYDLAANFGGINIYVRNTLKRDWQKNKNIDEWIKTNIPEKSSLAILTDNSGMDMKSFTNKNIDFIEGSYTQFENNLENNLELYAYLGKTIDLSLDKEDYNLREGSDEIIFYVEDVNGKKIIESSVPDDGVILSSGKRSSEKTTYKILKELPEQGVYKLIFKSVNGNDWIIKNLKINTNKIIGTENKPENHFDPFIFNLTVDKNSDFIVTDYSFHRDEINPSWIIAQKSFSSKDLFRDEKNNVKFSLHSPGLADEFDLIDINLNDYEKLGSLDNFTVWNKKDLSEHENVMEKIESINDYILDKLKDNIYFNFDFVDEISTSSPKKATTTPSIINKDTKNTKIVFELRGTHNFLTYLNKELEFKITKKDLNWYEGADNITVSLFTLSGKKICQTAIPDDGNISKDQKSEKSITGILLCKNLKHGVYQISIEESAPEKNNDFLIQDIDTGADKIIFKDQVQDMKPKKFYLENKDEKILKFYFWNENNIQKISFKDGNKKRELSLKKEDVKKETEFTLGPGNWEIETEKGGVRISGANFAIGKNNWFDISEYKKNFIIVKNPDKIIVPILKKISVEIE